VFYFKGYDTADRYEIWKSDGTNAGTVQLKDIFPGTGYGLQPGAQTQLVNLNGTCVFSARESADDYELWKTDGTAAGTHLAATVSVGEPGAPMLFATGSVGAFFIGHDDQA